MNQFDEALLVERHSFKYIISAFLNLSFEKIKPGVFYSPQIRGLHKYEYFFRIVTELEKIDSKIHCQMLSWKYMGTEFYQNCPTLGESKLQAL